MIYQLGIEISNVYVYYLFSDKQTLYNVAKIFLGTLSSLLKLKY